MRPWLLDLTRLSSRAGRGALTGVDRVERAWARHLTDSEEDVFGLVRTAAGFLLLDGQGVALFRDGPLPELAVLRRAASARCLRWDLRRLLRRLPSPFVYLNLAHSNRSAAVRAAVQSAGGRAVWMVHDTIPLDLPEVQTAASGKRMRAILAAAARADVVIFPSRASRRAAEMHVPAPLPQSVIAPPGPGLPAWSGGAAAQPPYFLALGTIEPRKNIPFLLDIWDEIGGQPSPPLLKLVGARGWESPEVLDRIGRTAYVEELGPLPDETAAQLLSGASGLLFPSRAEGFGIPLLEAALAGTPSIAAPLDVYREWMGNICVYAETTDRYLWKQRINELTQATVQRAARIDLAAKRGALPNWNGHFKAVRAELGQAT